jgi:hypothetical protein
VLHCCKRKVVSVGLARFTTTNVDFHSPDLVTSSLTYAWLLNKGYSACCDPNDSFRCWPIVPQLRAVNHVYKPDACTKVGMYGDIQALCNLSTQAECDAGCPSTSHDVSRSIEKVEEWLSELQAPEGEGAYRS